MNAKADLCSLVSILLSEPIPKVIFSAVTQQNHNSSVTIECGRMKWLSYGDYEPTLQFYDFSCPI